MIAGPDPHRHDRQGLAKGRSMRDPEPTPSAFDAAYTRSAPLFGMAMSRDLRDYLDEHPAVGSALDLGCGDGRDTLHLLRRGFHVTAVDRSPSAIAALTARDDISASMRALLTATHADVRTWAWPQATFDLVVATTLLDHLPADDLAPVVARMAAAAKPDALIFVQVHSTDDPAVTGNGSKSEFAREIRHYFAPNELLDAFRAHVRVLKYEERTEWDSEHGAPHAHGFAVLLGRVKPRG
jgi:SAM-dependent methyltransferase